MQPLFGPAQLHHYTRQDLHPDSCSTGLKCLHNFIDTHNLYMTVPKDAPSPDMGLRDDKVSGSWHQQCAHTLDTMDVLQGRLCSWWDRNQTDLASLSWWSLRERWDSQSKSLPWLICKASCSRLCKNQWHNTSLPSGFLKPGSSTPTFLPCCQQISFYKNNNPPLSQKNKVPLNNCN